jgi:hypothetical protein
VPSEKRVYRFSCKAYPVRTAAHTAGLIYPSSLTRTYLVALPGPAVAHGSFSLGAKSVRLVADEGDNHAVKVEEEHQEVETKLDEGFLELGVSVRLARPYDVNVVRF